MTSSQVRQSFLDFFKSKQHTIVPSSSLMPDSPNLLFTNAGMNQFVPIFLGQTKCPYTPGRAADTQKCIRAGGKHNDLDDVGLDTYHHTFFEMLGNWSFGDYFKQEAIAWAWELVVEVWKFPPQRIYATIYQPDKAKNDPAERDEEAWGFWAEKFRSVGLDPDIHIVNGGKKDNFWMMGETGPCGPCTEVHVDLRPGPAQTSVEEQKSGRALVNGSDARCIEIWNNVFIQYNANPDGTFSPLPAKHVDTGMGFERVTSIIQGTKNLTDFQNAKISNYETDVFRPIFDALEKMSGKKYCSTLPGGAHAPSRVPDRALAVGSDAGPRASATGAVARADTADEASAVTREARVLPEQRAAAPLAHSEQEKIDVAFRVIADHIRTLSFAIADGIQPGNTDRNYVLRRILRRAVRYGRTLGFHEPFFYKLVDVLADTMGDVFPEIRAKKKHVQDVIRIEEEAFNKTLDKGNELFYGVALPHAVSDALKSAGFSEISSGYTTSKVKSEELIYMTSEELANVKMERKETYEVQDRKTKRIVYSGDRFEFYRNGWRSLVTTSPVIPAVAAFKLYDTYGFPLDLTELMARERGLTVDKEGFEKLMEEQRNRARAAQKKEVISLSEIQTTTPTQFVGFEKLETAAKVVEVVSLKDKTAVILDTSACYAEMGGQVGDTGELTGGGQLWRITNTQKSGNTWLHFIEERGAHASGVPSSGSARVPRAVSGVAPETASAQTSSTDEKTDEREARRDASPARETRALPVPGDLIRLSVDRDRRNAIQRHHTVTHLLHWALHEVVSKEASQKGSFVGPDKLTFDFNSAPLTPQQVADIEKLVNERILENAGVSWTEVPYADVKSRKDVMQFFGDKYGDTVRVVQIGGEANKLDGYSMELCGGTHARATGEIGLFRIVGENAIAAGVRRIEAVAGLTAYDVMKYDRELIKNVAGKVNSPVHELEKKIESLLAQQKALEKEVQLAQQRNASNAASELLGRAETVTGIPLITHNLGDANGDFLQAIADALKSRFKGVVVLGGGSEASVALVATVSADFTSKVQAGKIIQAIAPIVGGKGGGKPDNARGGGKDVSKLDEALAKVKSLLG